MEYDNYCHRCNAVTDFKGRSCRVCGHKPSYTYVTSNMNQSQIHWDNIFRSGNVAISHYMDVVYILGSELRDIGFSEYNTDYLHDCVYHSKTFRLIRGPFEQMILDARYDSELREKLREQMSDWQRDFWFGGYRQERVNEILDCIEAAPTQLTIKANGKKFHLVHGKWNDNSLNGVYTLEEMEQCKIPNETIVFGHEVKAQWMRKSKKELLGIDAHDEMYIGDGFIGTSCRDRAAFFRLDNEKEFYRSLEERSCGGMDNAFGN